MNAMLCVIFFLALQQPPTPTPAPDPCDANCQIAQQNLAIALKVERFTGLLFVVGVAQALAMYWQGRLSGKTLREIHAQASHMGKQTAILEKSVAVAQASADAAMAQITTVKQKERAQLRVSFDPIDINDPSPDTGFQIYFTVTIDGTTRARVFEDSIVAYIPDEYGQKPIASEAMYLPTTITPEMGQIRNYARVLSIEGMFEPELDPRKFNAVRDNKLTLHVQGSIRYKDVFEDVWFYQFHSIWQNYSLHAGSGVPGGVWYRTGGDDDRERRQKTV